MEGQESLEGAEWRARWEWEGNKRRGSVSPGAAWLMDSLSCPPKKPLTLLTKVRELVYLAAALRSTWTQVSRRI